MRYVSIVGIQDHIKFKIVGGSQLICEIMRIGHTISPLVYETELTGLQLTAMLEKFHLEQKHVGCISQNNVYKITSFDL